MYEEYLEVESVEIINLSKCKYSSEGEQKVECEDEAVVPEDERVESPLVADGGDESRQGVVAHEAVDADSEQVGNTREV